MALKHALEAVLLAAGFSLFGCGEGGQEQEEQCRQYQTVLEENFNADSRWTSDETSRGCPERPSSNGCYYSHCPPYYKPQPNGCYSTVCRDQKQEGYILSAVTNDIYKTFSVPSSLRIDRVIMEGNSFGRNVSLEVKIEDFFPVSLRGLGEEHDCGDILIKNFSEEERSFTRDGEFYFSIKLLSCNEAPERLSCDYTCECANESNKNNRYRCADRRYMEEAAEKHSAPGCYGLQKITFQQCIER